MSLNTGPRNQPVRQFCCLVDIPVTERTQELLRDGLGAGGFRSTRTDPHRQENHGAGGQQLAERLREKCRVFIEPHSRATNAPPSVGATIARSLYGQSSSTVEKVATCRNPTRE